MQNNTNENPLTLSQQAYLIGDSFKQINITVFLLYAFLTGYILLIIGTSIILPSKNPKDDLDDIKDAVISLNIFFSLLMLPYYIQSQRYSRKLNRWNKDYLYNSYTLIFNTTIPKGKNTGEKILSFARLIFPELRSDYLSLSSDFFDNIKYFFLKKFGKLEQDVTSKSLNYSINSYFLDLALKTEGGYFIVKDFKDKIVTIEDLKYLVKVISSRFKNRYLQTDIFRTVCVAKNYDPSFLNRESLELLMTQQLKAKFPVDLIVEEDVGYSVLWICN